LSSTEYNSAFIPAAIRKKGFFNKKTKQSFHFDILHIPDNTVQATILLFILTLCQTQAQANISNIKNKK